MIADGDETAAVLQVQSYRRRSTASTQQYLLRTQPTQQNPATEQEPRGITDISTSTSPTNPTEADYRSKPRIPAVDSVDLEPQSQTQTQPGRPAHAIIDSHAHHSPALALKAERRRARRHKLNCSSASAAEGSQPVDRPDPATGVPHAASAAVPARYWTRSRGGLLRFLATTVFIPRGRTGPVWDDRVQ